MTVLADTNVFVYRHEDLDPVKQAAARRTLRELEKRRELVVTPQVIGEYCATARRRWPERFDRATLVGEVERVVAACDVLPLDATVSIAALHASARYDLHYWDAQLWATAKVHGVRVVLTEDFEDGSEIEGVRFVDPFAPGFDVDALLAETG